MSVAQQMIWFGKNPPTGWVNLSTDFVNKVDTRLSPEHYTKYNHINYTEHPISNFNNWPFVLDELFKLSIGKTIFSLRFQSSSPNFSIPKFYRQIHHLSAGTAEFVSLDKSKNSDDYILCFTATRREFDVSRNWSFGILWDGRNEDFLKCYVDSVSRLTTSQSSIELIICGPKPTFEIELDHTVIQADENTERYANISRKKNLIIKHAKFENICLSHNRYQLADDFIKSFDRINHDYDVCVIKQVLRETGERVPDWVSQASDQRLTANYLLKYGEYSPYIYIPGGLVIGKKNILMANLFNDLGTWNMAEDVELSQRLMASDYLPRLNSKTVAQVLQLRKEIISDFKTPDVNNFYRNIDLFQGHVARGERYIRFIRRNIKLLFTDPAAILGKLTIRMKKNRN
ncbi:TPA: hypothetical protein JD264_01890 [Serratia fonticola]|nr:hypothetical protein [Serratia fonticola]